MYEELEIMGMDAIEIENTSIEDIDNENVNLIFVAIDKSGSMDGYSSDMKKALNDFKGSLLNSKEVDEILVARADFANDINIGGYKRVLEFNTDYDANGMTALYDVIKIGADKLRTYMNYLKIEGMRVKAVFAVFSDGEDTSSRNELYEAKKMIRILNDEEIVTAFISFGGGAVKYCKNLGI